MWYTDSRACCLRFATRSVVSIVVPSYCSATGWTRMNPETVFVAPPSRVAKETICPPRLDLVRFLRQLHHNTVSRTLHNPEHKYQTHVFQVKRQLLSLCWDILKHDVPLVDTTCTDKDEVEERDVIHHELCQLRSDASWTSEDETQNVRSCRLSEEDLPFLLPLLPLPRDLAGFRSVDG